MKKLSLLLTLMLSMGTAMAADNFVLCTDASQLKEGTQLYIGDPTRNPQTLMGDAGDASTNKQPAEVATIVDGVVTDAGNGVVFTLESAGDGKWYFKDSNGNYLYGNHTGNNLFMRPEDKSAFKVTIDNEGNTRIFYEFDASWGLALYYIFHSTANGDGYICTNTTTGQNRFYPNLYVLDNGDTPVVPAPEAVTFTPAEGEVEAGTVVTITAKGATHISYTYNDATGEADGESINVTINEAGTVNVTASNDGGTVIGSASYTIKAVVPTPDAPEAVTFTPAGGAVEAGTVVTITAKGATHISYTYNDATGEADGESINVTINEAGTVNVTASNDGGTVNGNATYTIKGDDPVPPTPDGEVIYSGLDEDAESIDWDLGQNSVTWYWMEIDGKYYLDGSFDPGIAYEPMPITLPDAEDIKITAIFWQNVEVEGTAFLVREYGTETWTELAITSAAARADSNEASVNLTDYKGKTVQVGLKYGGGEEDWMVNNLKIISKEETGIGQVNAADENATVVYYNLQGMRINADAMTPGIYVRLEGRKATKVLVR